MRGCGESLRKGPRQGHDDIFGRPGPVGWGRMSQVPRGGSEVSGPREPDPCGALEAMAEALGFTLSE